VETLPLVLITEESPTLSHDDRLPTATAGRSRRFVGRMGEVAALDDARRALARGRGSITLVDGEAGIGKSRLVAHALAPVGGGRASRIVAIECVAETVAELAPFRAALGAMWNHGSADASPLALRAVAQLLAEPPGADAARADTGPTLGKTELFGGLIAAFAIASAKRGTILVLEDIHWADRTSLEFLAALGPHIETMRLMIVATCRSEAFEQSDALADVVSRLLRGRGVRHLPLRPLARTDVTELIDDALGGRATVASDTYAAIVERCEGNPFFAEELVKAALAGAGAGEALPLSIRAGIRHRLAALAAGDRVMLDVAAVLGVRFDRALVGELTGRADPDVVRMLRAARAANIVDEVDAATFRFHHALTRQAIYEALLQAETQALHRRILTALEARDATERTVEELAYHAWQARDAAATLRYSELAGDRARERGMFSDASRYYERIVSAVPDDDARARLHERLGTIATAQGDFARAIAQLEIALELRVALGHLDDAARIAVALAVERSNSGADAVPELEAFLERSAAQLSDRARDGVLVFLARLASALGGFARSEALLGDVSSPATLEPRVRANYLTCRLNASEHRGATGAWRDAAREMLALAPELPPLMRSIQLTNVAQTGAWLGERSITQAALADAQAIARDWGFEGIGIFSRAVEAHVAFLAGDLDAARVALDAVARRPDVAPAVVLAARVGPFVAAALGDAVLSARYLDEHVVRAARERGDDDDALYLDAAALAFGPRAAAPALRRSLLDRLTAHAGALIPPTVAVAAAEHLEPAQLPALIAICGSAAAAAEHPVAMATHALVRAIAARRGDAEVEAEGFANAARAMFEIIGWPLFAARARDQATTRDEQASAPLLTGREAQIASLIAGGATNATIAGTLQVGVKTVEKHVSNILTKLGARSRAQIAAFVAESGGRVSTHAR
jgi:DNA-binding CsgD family transcriptional regulator